VPVTIVLVLLVNRSALRATQAPTPSSPPASATSASSASTSASAAPATSASAPGATPLPVVRVAAPPPSADAARSCPPFLAAVPLRLTDLAARPVDSPSPFVAAWGEPPVLLRCGVVRPRGFVVGAQTIAVNGVTWYPEPQGNRTVWTAVDRPVYIELSVPTGYASGPVAVLSTAITRTLPAQPARPGR
jgi:hypothetical protein